MLSDIQVFLFPDTIKFFQNNDKIVKELSSDTNTTIKINSRRKDPYISIKGQFEECHKARIVIQDIEKDNYRKAYIDKGAY
jgi:hypothetical protein